MAHKMTMTNAMQKLNKWYTENVTTVPFKVITDSLNANGYTHHHTDDGKLFKLMMETDGSITLFIMKEKLSLYKTIYREDLQGIITTMINGMSHNGNPKMTSITIGEFAYWCANDDVNIEECGLTYSHWAYYLLYVDAVDDEVEEITFTNEDEETNSINDNEIDSYSVNDGVIKKLWVELYDIKGKVDNIVNILGNVGDFK